MAGIQEFTGKCLQGIAQFESLVNQLKKNSGDINDRLKSIEETELFKFPSLAEYGNHMPSAKVRRCCCRRRCCYCRCFFYLMFLDAPSHLYKRLCPSVRPSVGPSVPSYFPMRTRRILCRVSGLVIVFTVFFPSFLRLL